MSERERAVDQAAKHPETERCWSVVVSRDQYQDDIVANLDRVADLARAGAWDDLLSVLETPSQIAGPERVNTPRVGSKSGFASLHQAAWHGAGRDVVGRLIELRAWRSMRTTDGRLPIDIAQERGHGHLEDLLSVPEVDQFTARRRAAIESFLHTLIEVRARSFGVDGPLRLPQVGPIWEIAPEQHVWCGVPGMYGGFVLQRDGDDLVTESWCRVVDGSEQEHRITEDEVRLVSGGQ